MDSYFPRGSFTTALLVALLVAFFALLAIAFAAFVAFFALLAFAVAFFAFAFDFFWPGFFDIKIFFASFLPQLLLEPGCLLRRSFLRLLPLRLLLVLHHRHVSGFLESDPRSPAACYRLRLLGGLPPASEGLFVLLPRASSALLLETPEKSLVSLCWLLPHLYQT